MNLKKILSGFLAAAMAVTTMVTATFSASAAAEKLVDVGNSYAAAKSIVVTYDLLSTEVWTNATLVLNYAHEDADGQKDYLMIGLGGADQEQWFQGDGKAFISFDGTPVHDGKYTYDLKCVPDGWFEILYEENENTDCMINTVELFDGTNGTGESLYKWTNPAMDTTEYKEYDITATLNDNSMAFSGSFDTTKVVGPGAAIVVEYTITDSENYGVNLYDTDDIDAGKWDSPVKSVSGSTTGETIFKFSDVTLPTRLTINTWGCTITAVKVKNGGDNVYVPAVTSHTITVSPTIENGTVTADKATAAKDEKVTLTVDPAEGYELDTLTVATSTAGTDTVTVAADNTFTMPDADVTVTATFKAAALKEITLDKTTASVLVGKTVALTATKDPVTDKTEITWTSSDETVATVAGGVVTGKKAGTAVITATCGTKSATCAVTVTAEEIACTGVTLDKTEAVVMKGATVTLKATALPEGTTDTITWTTTDASIATVKDGVVTGVARGTAKITAKCGEKTAECKVSVNEEETVTAPSDPTKPAKTFKSAVTDGKYNDNEVFVLSAADVAAAKSVSVTVTDSNGKKFTQNDITKCYKKVTYKAADDTIDTITANGGDCLLAVTVTGIPDGTTVTVSIAINK